MGVVLAVALLAVFVPAGRGEVRAANDDVVPGQFIVVVQPGADPPRVAQDHAAVPLHVYTAVARGFAARLSPAQVAALKADPRVNNVVPDRQFYVLPKPEKPDKPGKPTPTPTPTPPAEVVPTGVDRIDAEGAAPGAAPVAVAIVDTGITPHPDLNLVDSVNFVRTEKTADDLYGHGTHVAGIVGATADNGIGVRGVAPGVALYNVKVCGRNGICWLSDIIAGVDWVTKYAAANDIKVANMSLGGGGGDTDETRGTTCGEYVQGTQRTTVDPYHKAICDSARAGVVYVVAAGNESDAAARHTPAAYDEVITVSAIADFDGKGGGGATENPCGSTDGDDTFADFSNYGHDVDLAAPGVCILSTWKDGGYRYASGTSMAAPHVTGAVALLVSQGSLSVGPSGDPMKARNDAMDALKTKEQGDRAFGFTGDPDSYPEPLVYVGSTP